MAATLRKAASYLAGVGFLLVALALVASALDGEPTWLPRLSLAVGVVLIISYGLLRP